jgi:acyl-CoA reductase-like NAD-dependent aldehyde dehydrogenase
VETLKDGNDYLRLEQDLKSLENLRRQYREEIEKTYKILKSRVEQQVKQATQQLSRQAAAQGAAIDIEGSVEASTKATPEWKSFMAKHESTYNQKFKDYLDKLLKKLQG